MDKIPPNVQLLQRSEFGRRLPIETEDDSVAKFHLFSSLFAHTLPKTLKDQCNVENYGFDINTDRAYVRNLDDKSSASKMFSSTRAARNAIKGACIVSVDGKPTFTMADVIGCFRRLQADEIKSFDRFRP